MDNNWNLKKLKKQAIRNQDFDNYVLNQSRILDCDNLKVLDVGCSNEFKTKLMFDKYKNIKYILGIDIDEQAINEAKENFKNNDKYKFELKKIEDLDENNKYDIIYLSYILQHLKNPTKVLKTLKNMLSDRGVLIIKVPDDNFKLCYPNPNNLLHKIFFLYKMKL